MTEIKQKYYTFTVYVGSYGDTSEEAWKDAMNNFIPEEEEMPMSYSEEEVDEEQEK